VTALHSTFEASHIRAKWFHGDCGSGRRAVTGWSARERFHWTPGLGYELVIALSRRIYKSNCSLADRR